MLANCCDDRCDDRSDDEDAQHHRRHLREDDHEAPNALHSYTLRKAAQVHIGSGDDFGLILQE